MGFPIYNSDNKANWLINNNSLLKTKIINNFGKESFINDKLNKKFISEIVFNNYSKLKLLNSLVHPIVSKDFKYWLLNYVNKSFVIKEAAILIESGSYKEMDKVILITCPENLRINRVMKRDSINLEFIKKIIRIQMKENEKMKFADYIIKNDSTLKDLKKKVYLIINKIHKEYSLLK